MFQLLGMEKRRQNLLTKEQMRLSFMERNLVVILKGIIV